ncbi:MAG: hypothetical protein ABEJ77_02305 [Halanaeroarchaeum sp.]
MTDVEDDRDELRALAGEIATTAHPRLDAATVDRAIASVESIASRLESEDPDAAVEDLLAFWEGYVRQGLSVTEVDAPAPDVSLSTLFERGNEGDLYGLDLYQALYELAEARDPSGSIDDLTVDWADRVAELTVDFVDHLRDHQ